MKQLDNVFNNNLTWQMSYPEKSSILHLLSKLETKNVAIEIGSFRGGFLQVLSEHFSKVYSLDIDHTQLHVEKDYLSNVEFITGDSRDTLPKLIEHMNSDNDCINFVLIDGDHSYEAVKTDIENILKYIPKSEMFILFHDSWYSPTRDAINNANWNDNRHVQYVEKDFCTGDIIDHSVEKLITIGGLALAYLTKDERGKETDIEVKQTYDFMYRVVNNFFKNNKVDV